MTILPMALHFNLKLKIERDANLPIPFHKKKGSKYLEILYHFKVSANKSYCKN
jgi:hypothetical protein